MAIKFPFTMHTRRGPVTWRQVGEQIVEQRAPESAWFIEAKRRVVAAGGTVSARSWEGDRYAYACSVETCGPATFGHPRFEFQLDKRLPL